MCQGVESFDHSKNLNILVTGSADHHVRLWNPYVTNKPVAILTGHATGVIGVAIHEGFLQVFSYSKDAVCIGLVVSETAVRGPACGLVRHRIAVSQSAVTVFSQSVQLF